MASRITTRSRHSKTARSRGKANRDAGPQQKPEKPQTSPGTYLNLAPRKQERLKNRRTNPRPKIRETGETSRENKTKRVPPKQPDREALLALAIGRLKARVVPKKRAEVAPARPNRSKARKSQPSQNRRPAPLASAALSIFAGSFSFILLTSYFLLLARHTRCPAADTERGQHDFHCQRAKDKSHDPHPL